MKGNLITLVSLFKNRLARKICQSNTECMNRVGAHLGRSISLQSQPIFRDLLVHFEACQTTNL